MVSSILPKNERKNSTLLLWYLRPNCFRSFFGRIEETINRFRDLLTFTLYYIYIIQPCIRLRVPPHNWYLLGPQWANKGFIQCSFFKVINQKLFLLLWQTLKWQKTSVCKCDFFAIWTSSDNVYLLKVSKFRKQIFLFSFEPKNKRNYFLISALASKNGSNQKSEGTLLY